MARENAYYQGPRTDHFDGSRFFNPGQGNDLRSPLELLRWRLTRRVEPWPKALPPRPTDRPPLRVDGRQCRLVFVGHASFLIQTAGLNILLDPVWSERASPFAFAGPARFVPPGIVFDDLPAIDAVLVSHNHYDHLDVATLRRLWRRDRPRLVTPLGNDAIIRKGDASLKVETIDWGASVALSPEVRVHCVRASHWSARGMGDRCHALWGAFVIETPGGGLYCVGDTGFADGSTFTDIGRAYPDLRLALLPIGAYEPRWFMRPHHMNPEEAVEAFRLCGARRAVAHHWGTFRLTDEAYDDPPRALAAALAAGNIDPARFVAPVPGEALDIP